MVAPIGIIAGSSRTGSYNLALAGLVANAMNELGREAWVAGHHDLDLPIYHGDLEQRAFPPAALALKQRIAACEALVLVCPEYNGSLSPLLKNALDWASRSTGDEPPLAVSAFRGKAVLLASATPGPGAGIRALSHLRQVVQALQMIALPLELRIGNAAQVFGGAPGEVLGPQVSAASEQLLALSSKLRPCG